MEALTCGCVPMAGGGVVSRCTDGAVLWHWYLLAIQTDPGNRAAWFPRFEAYVRHIGQEAWT